MGRFVLGYADADVLIVPGIADRGVLPKGATSVQVEQQVKQQAVIVSMLEWPSRQRINHIHSLSLIRHGPLLIRQDNAIDPA